MRCPHCQAESELKWHTFALGQDPDGTWQVATTRCPVCERILTELRTDRGETYPAWPAGSTRPPLSDDVPAEWRNEYRTACQVLYYSREASAAISRRLLQRCLTQCLGTTEQELAAQIAEAERSPALPRYLKEGFDLLARLSKLTMGSDKSRRPDALFPSEPGEAEWLLDLLETLFDFHFVQPARLERRKNALQAALTRREPAKDDEPAASAETQSAAREPGDGDPA